MSPVTIQKYNIIIDYILHTLCFISVTLLFCNWKFLPLNLPHLFLVSPHLATTSLFSVSMTLFLFDYICSLCFLDSTYKWNHIVLVFDLFHFSIIPSLSIHVGAHDKLSVILYGRGMPTITTFIQHNSGSSGHRNQTRWNKRNSIGKEVVNCHCLWAIWFYT